jgi:trans-aconitate 2-methyltransferase
MTSKTPRAWDAASYDRVGGPMTAMAATVLERLPLAGDETVLDAGCGTGRGTQLLIDRLPRGRVIAIDADPEMVRVARRNLGDRAEVRQANLLDLTLDEVVDAVFSTATFHWVRDHERLFAHLFSALRPGGRLVAQCGGRGNLAELRACGDAVAAETTYASWFAGWTAPQHYAGPEETAERLEAAGFTEVHTWIESLEVVPDDPFEYLATVTLGAQVQRLPQSLQANYVDEVLRRLAAPVKLGYVRLNLDARRPDAASDDQVSGHPAGRR